MTSEVANWKLPCGCKVNSTTILKACKGCEERWEILSEQAKLDYKKSIRAFDEQVARHREQAIATDLGPTTSTESEQPLSNGDLTSLM